MAMRVCCRCQMGCVRPVTKGWISDWPGTWARSASMMSAPFLRTVTLNTYRLIEPAMKPP